jgi:mannose-6-phosphate isomerase class I
VILQILFISEIIKNSDNTVFVITYDKVIKEEEFLSKNHKYKKSKL